MKKVIIILTVIAAVVLGYTAYNNYLENKVRPDPAPTSAVINQPILINDSAQGFSFETKNGGVAIKGSSHCCPQSWSIGPTDTNTTREGIEIFVPGSSDDPKNWAIAKRIGSQVYGNNTFEVYRETNNSGDYSYEFTMVNASKGIIITSQSNPPEYIDLSSIKIN